MINEMTVIQLLDFNGWWQLEGEWVEAANIRRKGNSGVQRIVVLPGEHQQVLYIKRQVGHLYRSWRYPLGRPTVLREYQTYQAFQRLGVTLPTVVFAGTQYYQGQWRALLVTEALEGFCDMESWYRSGAYQNHSPASRQKLLTKLAQTLSRFHRMGWQFGCLYPKHIFIRLDEHHAECALLDLEKCRRRLSPKTAARRDLDQLYRHRGAMPDADWAYFRQQATGNSGAVLCTLCC